jgi:hypothetical protein
MPAAIPGVASGADAGHATWHAPHGVPQIAIELSNAPGVLGSGVTPGQMRRPGGQASAFSQTTSGSVGVAQACASSHVSSGSGTM